MRTQSLCFWLHTVPVPVPKLEYLPGFSGPLSAFNLHMCEHLKFYAGKRQSNIQIWPSMLHMCKTVILLVMDNGPENPDTVDQEVFGGRIFHINFPLPKHLISYYRTYSNTTVGNYF